MRQEISRNQRAVVSQNTLTHAQSVQRDLTTRDAAPTAFFVSPPCGFGHRPTAALEGPLKTLAVGTVVRKGFCFFLESRPTPFFRREGTTKSKTKMCTKNKKVDRFNFSAGWGNLIW